MFKIEGQLLNLWKEILLTNKNNMGLNPQFLEPIPHEYRGKNVGRLYRIQVKLPVPYCD